MEHLIAVIVGGALMFLGFVIGSIIVLTALIKLAKVNAEESSKSLKPLAKMMLNSSYEKDLPVFDVNSTYPAHLRQTTISEEAFAAVEINELIKLQDIVIERSKDIFDKVQEILVRDPNTDPTEDELEEISDLVRDGWAVTRGHGLEQTKETPVDA